jgi:predicted neutral ceramidase superfamily lipid hydrolase
MTSAGRVIIYLIGAGVVLGITYGFFYAISHLSTYLGGFSITVYSRTVWEMSGILAALIVFSAIAKDHASLEIISSATFLVYVLFAYAIGNTILTLFIPYSGLGKMNLQFVADLSHVVPSISTVLAGIVFTNLLTAGLLIVGEGLRFLNTLAKASRTKVTKKTAAPAQESSR